MESVTEISIDGIDDYTLLCMNEPRVWRIEVDDGTTVQTYPIDPDQPFVMVLPRSTDGYTLYDENGEVVPAVVSKG